MKKRPLPSFTTVLTEDLATTQPRPGSPRFTAVRRRDGERPAPKTPRDTENR